MKIDFDRQLRIAGLGLVPWTRLGPEQWLPRYAIASLYGWDMPPSPDLPKVFALSDNPTGVPNLRRLNTQELVRSRVFQVLLNDKLPGYDLLTYKPIAVPHALANRKFLMVDGAFTDRYENKVLFRQQFASRIMFPPFTVYAREQLSTKAVDFEALLEKRAGVVIQDEQLSGGKGTFIVTTYEDYRYALSELERLASQNVVVSDLIVPAKERSIQCCVTGQGVFTGPLQRQIVRHPLLANLEVVDGDKFCGAQILAIDQGTPEHQEATGIGQQIGSVLHSEGYRGVFGVDFLLTGQGKLLTLEVNPRLTGVTPLLTALYRGENGIPFYLLHLLELGQYAYRITDTTAQFDKTGALLVLHSLSNRTVYIRSMPASGTYKLADGKLLPISRNIDVDKLAANEFIFQEYMPPGMPIKPGGRLAIIMTRDCVIDLAIDKLYNSTTELINILRQHIIT